MRLHRPAGHLELPGNFGVITTLQQQFNNLLFPGSQLFPTLFHHPYSRDFKGLTDWPNTTVTKSYSIHHAILRRFLAVTAKH